MGRRTKLIIYRGAFALAAFACFAVYHEGPANLLSSALSFPTTYKQQSFAGNLQSLFMTEQQCATNFPGLTKEIDDAVARGPFDFKRRPNDYSGLVQGRIKDGKLYIISTENTETRNRIQERTSAIHQLHRAIVTSPTPLPDTIFSLSILDTPTNNTWTFSRSNDPAWEAEGNYWLMPHFSFWSWPLSFIGSVDEVLAKIDRVEQEKLWTGKIDKAVWRGTGWFNSIVNIDLRQKLVVMSKDKEWADIEVLKWDMNSESAANSINIADFCKYKYIVYTEGITYSGRLLFHEACASVVLSPPITYLLHTTHLVRPIFSSSFLPPRDSDKKFNWWAGRWPRYELNEANAVFVKPDWSDLEETIMFLRSNPEIANGIAQRQRELFTRYLSPASEVCYWRALIKGWSQVAKPVYGDGDGSWDAAGVKDLEGMRWETLSLIGRTKWKE